MNIIPLILAGGEGKRLRPLTSAKRPKPFLKLFGRPSLFQNTLKRLSPYASPIIVTHSAYAPYVKAQMTEFGREPMAILQEPAHRSTAPAIGLAAQYLGEHKDAVMLICPSDHYIGDQDILHNAIQDGKAILRREGQEAQVERNGKEQEAAVLSGDSSETFVSIGAAPKGPGTRYGYIQYDTDFTITKFTEKPGKQTARQYLAQGHCAWNTGMFLCRPSTYLKALERFRPQIYHALSENRFEDSPSEAVDTAIMENLTAAKLVLLETEWRDLGTLSEFLMNILCIRS